MSFKSVVALAEKFETNLKLASKESDEIKSKAAEIKKLCDHITIKYTKYQQNRGTIEKGLGFVSNLVSGVSDFNYAKIYDTFDDIKSDLEKLSKDID